MYCFLTFFISGPLRCTRLTTDADDDGFRTDTCCAPRVQTATSSSCDGAIGFTPAAVWTISAALDSCCRARNASYADDSCAAARRSAGMQTGRAVRSVPKRACFFRILRGGFTAAVSTNVILICFGGAASVCVRLMCAVRFLRRRSCSSRQRCLDDMRNKRIKILLTS